MDISLFDYNLPPELIAQFPNRRRDRSRLLVVDRKTGTFEHRKFADIAEYLRKGDTLVVNNTKVFKARLFGKRVSGGKVEVFLVRPVPEVANAWLALVMPSRRVKAGEDILFDERERMHLAEDVGRGFWRVEFRSRSQQNRVIARFGHVPLPHYIGRADQPSDIRRYQTVFADPSRVGAVAAPTAGFHFTGRLLRELESRGVGRVELTLHVGPGTFKPIKADIIEEHIVDPEYAELTTEAAEAINAARSGSGSVVAVGTTSVRTLESAPVEGGRIQSFAGMVDLYIKPGHRFRMVDRLITNFHLPKSSLLVLVSAFAGRELILEAYHEAISRGYRFYSYGDAMLIL